jgi:hypothetical protein
MNNIVAFPTLARTSDRRSDLRSALAAERAERFTAEEGRAFGVAALHGWLSHDLCVLARDLEQFLRVDAGTAAARIGLPTGFVWGFAVGCGLVEADQGDSRGMQDREQDPPQFRDPVSGLDEDQFHWDHETWSRLDTA